MHYQKSTRVGYPDDEIPDGKTTSPHVVHELRRPAKMLIFAARSLGILRNNEGLNNTLTINRRGFKRDNRPVVK